MVKLILIGLLAGAFFSSTFILNELMSASGGHWFWSASLCYLFMLFLVSLLITIQQGFATLNQLSKVFSKHWQFWCITGGTGFGLFYAGICYAADHAQGWVVTSTFMFTVVASLFVLRAFGQKFSKQVIVFALMIFVGVIMVNISEASNSQGTSVMATQTHDLLHTILFGALPALIASFSYPIGNQLVWQASHNAKKNVKTSVKNNTSTNAINLAISTTQPAIQTFIPTINTDLLDNAFNKVWLLTLGSFPFWIFLGLILHPALPSMSQTVNTFLVALFSGVIATSLFLYAREHANSSQQVAGVDATQASEVIFALIGGMLFLGTSLPSLLGLIGIGLIILGLVLFAKFG